MELNQDELDYLRCAVQDAARTYILPRFRALDAQQISMKSGPVDLVTVADTEAEAALTAQISADWPNALVLGEEAVSADPTILDGIGAAERAVILDPVDGTWNFAKGLAVFGVILAVTSHGKPMGGVLYDPVLDDWIETRFGEGAWLAMPDGTRRACQTSGNISGRRPSGYVPMGVMPPKLKPRLAQVCAEFARVNTLRCSLHEYRMLAQGHVDFILSGPQPHPWDHAVGSLAVQEAGGVVRFLDGRDYIADGRRGILLSAGSEETWQLVADKVQFLTEN